MDVNKFEEWLISKFRSLNIDLPENQKLWIPILEDVLDTDIASLFYMEGI